MRERKELEGMLHDVAARVPGAGRGRTRGRGRDRRPAGRLCVTRGYVRSGRARRCVRSVSSMGRLMRQVVNRPDTFRA